MDVQVSDNTQKKDLTLTPRVIVGGMAVMVLCILLLGVKVLTLGSALDDLTASTQTDLASTQTEIDGINTQVQTLFDNLHFYTETQTLSGHTNGVNALAYDQDTKTLFSGSYDGTIKVWTPDGSGNYDAGASQTLSGHGGSVRALAYDQATKTLFSGSGDFIFTSGTIKVWTPDGSGNYDAGASQTLTGESRFFNTSMK